MLLEDKVLMAAHLKWSDYFSVVGAVIYNLDSMWNFFPNRFELLKKKSFRPQFQVVAHFSDCGAHIFSTKLPLFLRGFRSFNGMVFLIILDQTDLRFSE